MAQTKLDVINSMLATTGTAPLTANDLTHPSYIRAVAKYDEVDIEWQGKGWWFNTTTKVLQPTGDNELVFSQDALHVDPLDTNKNFVIRGNRLYDMDNDTFTITEEAECWMIRLKPFEELPPNAAAWLRATLRYEFYLDVDGSEPKLSSYLNARALAWNFLQTEHLKKLDVNFFKGGHGIWFRQRYQSQTANRSVARQPT